MWVLVLNPLAFLLKASTINIADRHSKRIENSYNMYYATEVCKRISIPDCSNLSNWAVLKYVHIYLYIGIFA